MDGNKLSHYLRKLFSLLFLWWVPWIAHASFIEATMGTAVVNDATATYYNPAALTLLQNPQIIGLSSFAFFHQHFSGQSTQVLTGLTQSGPANSHTRYFLPALYSGAPINERVTIGLAIVSNYFNNTIENNSILRYVQSSNKVENIDVVPAVGIKLNEMFSVGAGINFSYADFLLKPILGFPSLNIPDGQSHNEASGTGVGGDVGILLKPSKSTLLGLNYRSAITYRLSGASRFNGNPRIVSQDYHFNFWTPARIVLSASQLMTTKLGLVSTIERIQWSIFESSHIHGIATPLGIVNATVPYHLQDTWLITLGGHYRLTPRWVIRGAGSYMQSPGNNHYQLANGDSYIVGVSTGYEINKHWIIDGSYAHVFIQNENIHIQNNRNRITGVNSASRDGLTVKLTCNA